MIDGQPFSPCPPPVFADPNPLRMIKPDQAAPGGFIGRTFLTYRHGHSHTILSNPMRTKTITFFIQTVDHDEASLLVPPPDGQS